jgi:hypothetical protein
MKDTTYNGWTNYATWRVNLEMFDGIDPQDDYGLQDLDVYDLAKRLQEHAEELICDYKNETSLAQDYALAFLSDVNWAEIARHMIADYADA